MTLTTKHKILLTGLEPTSIKAASFVREMKAQPIIFPLQETVHLKPQINDHYDWCIFTSPASVRLYFESGFTHCFSKAACVGPSTQKVLEDYKITCDLIPEAFNSKSLVQAFSDVKVKGNSILYPCSAQQHRSPNDPAADPDRSHTSPTLQDYNIPGNVAYYP